MNDGIFKWEDKLYHTTRMKAIKNYGTGKKSIKYPINCCGDIIYTPPLPFISYQTRP